jgi:hypothetical protein
MAMFRSRSLAVLMCLGAVALGLVACSSSSKPATPSPSLPAPGGGKITFYLDLPANTKSLATDAMAVVMPGTANYRRFASIADLANKYGATASTIRTTVSGIAKTGLSVAVDPSQLFARVSGTVGQWSSALQTPLGEQPATWNDPFDVYSLPKQLPAALQPNGATWLFAQATVYEPGADGSRPTTAPVHHANDRPTASPAATPWPTNSGTIGANVCQQQAVTAGQIYTPA